MDNNSAIDPVFHDREEDNDREEEHDGSVSELLVVREEGGGDHDSMIPTEEEETDHLLDDAVVVDDTEEEERHHRIIREGRPRTPLELAQRTELERTRRQLSRLHREVSKLKAFISKRKQTYKRKRKDEGAPTRALSAYNIFIRDRFSKLAQENEEALQSADADAQMKRVPPSSLVASTGNVWKELSADEKAVFQNKAAEDKKRYDGQMAEYQPPKKHKSKKRNKTGYNLFFSAYVERLKQTESGVPSERGSCARVVGSAWKDLSSEDKQYYESQAEKENALVEPGDDQKDDDEYKISRKGSTKHAPHGGKTSDSHEDRHNTDHHHHGLLTHHNSPGDGVLVPYLPHGTQQHSHVNNNPQLAAHGGYHHPGPPMVGYHHGYAQQQQHPSYHNAHTVHTTPRGHLPPQQYAQHLPSYH